MVSLPPLICLIPLSTRPPSFALPTAVRVSLSLVSSFRMPVIMPVMEFRSMAWLWPFALFMEAWATVRAFSTDLLRMLMSPPEVSWAPSVTRALQFWSTTATAKKPPKLMVPSLGAGGVVVVPPSPVEMSAFSSSAGGSSWEMVVTEEVPSARMSMFPSALITPSTVVTASRDTTLSARDRGTMPMVATEEVVTSALLDNRVRLPEVMVPVVVNPVRASAAATTTDRGTRIRL